MAGRRLLVRARWSKVDFPVPGGASTIIREGCSKKWGCTQKGIGGRYPTKREGSGSLSESGEVAHWRYTEVACL